MNQELLDTTIRESIRDIKCPYPVDVVDKVMSQISKVPVPMAMRHTDIHLKNKRLRGIGTIAACLAITLGIGLTILHNVPDDAPVGALVNDISSYVEDYSDPNEYYDNQFSNIETLILSEDAECDDPNCQGQDAETE